MNQTLTLSSDQLEELTGKVRWSAQIKALRQMGFEVKVRPDGFPLVDIDHYKIMMGAVPPKKRMPPAKLSLENV